MRIRERIVPHPTCANYALTFSPTTTYGNWGWLPCFPIVRSQGAASYWTPLPLEEERIEDEVSSGRGIKNVTHVKVKRPFFDPKLMEPEEELVDALRASSGSMPSAYKPYAGALQYYAQTGEYGWKPRKEAWDESSLIRRWHIEYGSPMAGYQIPDSLAGTLPAKIVRRMDGYHSSTDVVEAREFPRLFDMFRRRSETNDLVRELIRHPGRFGRKQGLALLREMRKFLLLKKFGVDPTVRQVQELCKELSRPAKPRQTEFSVHARKSESLGNQFDHGWESQAYGHYKCTESLSSYRVDGCHVVWSRPTYHNPFFKEADRFLSKWTGVNPIGLAWEVYPYSFMVDWFLSIDDAIDNIFIGCSSDVKTQYWVTQKVEYKRKVDGKLCVAVSGYSPAPPNREFIGPYTLSETVSSYDRRRCGGPSVSDSIRSRLNAERIFWSFLLAIGFRK